jgi:hypothetical protein
MPYGISKKLGGDTPEVDARMERCVQKVMAEGHSKVSAVLICKASIQKGLGNRRRKGTNA